MHSKFLGMLLVIVAGISKQALKFGFANSTFTIFIIGLEAEQGLTPGAAVAGPSTKTIEIFLMRMVFPTNELGLLVKATSLTSIGA